MKRRTFLKFTAGAASILSPQLFAGIKREDILLKKAKAKRVIFLTMSGGFSQFETFDNKPVFSKI